MFQGGAVSCTSFATVLASLEANPNSDPQTIEGVRKNYQQCLKDGGIDPGSQVSLSRKCVGGGGGVVSAKLVLN